MNRGTRTTMSFLALCALSAGALHAENLKQGGPYDLEVDPASQADAYVSAKNLEALRGVKKIAIPSFQVEFAIQNVASAWSSSSGGTTSSKTRVRLSGPDQAVLQHLTDALYDRVVADLEEAGLEVLPFEVVQANESYQKFKARQEPSPVMIGTLDGKSMFFGPHGMPVYFRGDDKRVNPLSLLSKGGFTVHPQNYEPRIADTLGAALLRVRMIVDIARQKTSGGFFASGSSVKTEAALAIMSEFTEFMILTPNEGKAVISLTEYVNAAEQIFEIKTAKQAGYVAPSFAVFGGPDEGDKPKDVQALLVTTPEDYERVVGEHLMAVNAMFMAKLKPAL